ncbi:MAG: helix-hairpin-helix domain-containing protein [Clostridiales bacterium]|nr:helix-hairpin-helix domain-containing protein [Clostridiales bacterium]
MDVKKQLAEEFGLKEEHCSNIVDLLDQGDTVPFIARYRKEMHGATDDQVIRELSERYEYLKGLEKRKEEIQASIESQGKWTDELATALSNAKTLTEAEDIYRPYKQKKKTRASVAIARGLEPLADIIEAQELAEYDEAELTAPYIDAEKEVPDSRAAIDGACDIIAERISDDAAIRKTLREAALTTGRLTAVLDESCTDDEKKKVYETYFKFDEAVATVPSHRVLAVTRGEKEGCLKVAVVVDEAAALNTIAAAKKKSSAFDALIDRTIEDSYKRLIAPSIEREVRAELFDRASEQAIKTFERNLKPLLLQPPLKGKVILGLDPAYRTGCKIAVIDASGKFLDSAVIYPTPPQKKIEQAKEVLKQLINKYNVDCISIGNGTASKESEIFVAELIKELERPVQYAVVSESGASVYSGSKLGADEFPELDLTIRSAISIARRLLDPLAELIKVDVRSLGVGQYQHDMPQKRLTSSLEAAVEDCVNSVGVDLNTASHTLLSYVSGLNATTAKNIVEYRSNKPFGSRKQLLEVPKLGAKAFEQCAGFLRITDGDNVLDNTAVHPESYDAAQKLIEKFGYTKEDVVACKLGNLPQRVKDAGEENVAAEIGVGVPTLGDIVTELIKPGRDVRDELPQPVLRSDLMDLNDLKEGMQIIGVVRNVTDFGAFVDISVHQDGLLHISEISDGFVRHPSDVLKVGDKVNVWVLSVDREKHRIALTMLAPATRDQRKADYDKQKQERAEQKAEREKKHAEYLERKAEREKKHAEYLERQARREARAKGEGEENGARPDRRDRNNGERRERFDGRNGERRERKFDRERSSGYRDRSDDRAPSTENMSMEEKLAALASRFNRK